MTRDEQEQIKYECDDVSYRVWEHFKNEVCRASDSVLDHVIYTIWDDGKHGRDEEICILMSEALCEG